MKYIDFPQSQLQALRRRLADHHSIWTTRVSRDRTRFNKGDILQNSLISQPLYVSHIQDIDSLETHPFNKQLTDQQKQLLNKYKKMRLLKLRPFISSVQDLKRFYSSVKYGLAGHTGDTSIQDYLTKWHLMSPDQLIKQKKGICYDTANMTDHYLTKLNIPHLNFFAYTKRSAGDDYNDDPTHTFTVYQGKDKKWRWLQGSWDPYKNNDFTSNTAQELVKIIGRALANASQQTNMISAIQKYPQAGINMRQFQHSLKHVIQHPVMQIQPDKLDKKSNYNNIQHKVNDMSYKYGKTMRKQAWGWLDDAWNGVKSGVNAVGQTIGDVADRAAGVVMPLMPDSVQVAYDASPAHVRRVNQRRDGRMPWQDTPDPRDPYRQQIDNYIANYKPETAPAVNPQPVAESSARPVKRTAKPRRSLMDRRAQAVLNQMSRPYGLDTQRTRPVKKRVVNKRKVRTQDQQEALEKQNQKRLQRMRDNQALRAQQQQRMAEISPNHRGNKYIPVTHTGRRV